MKKEIFWICIVIVLLAIFQCSFACYAYLADTEQIARHFKRRQEASSLRDLQKEKYIKANFDRQATEFQALELSPSQSAYFLSNEKSDLNYWLTMKDIDLADMNSIDRLFVADARSRAKNLFFSVLRDNLAYAFLTFLILVTIKRHSKREENAKLAA